MTNLARWTALAREPESPWAERLRLLAARIHEGETVIDVGAGGMWLRGMIPASCLYLPVDCVDGAPINLELGGNDYVAFNGDVVVASGVLEYVPEDQCCQAIHDLSDWAPRLLLSYAVVRDGEDRVGAGWVNDFDLHDLHAMLRRRYDTIDIFGWWQGQVLIEARR